MSLKKLSYEIGGTARKFQNKELVPYGADKWDKDKFAKMSKKEQSRYMNRALVASKKVVAKEKAKRVSTGGKTGALVGGTGGALGGALAGGALGAKGGLKGIAMGALKGSAAGGAIGGLTGGAGGRVAVQNHKPY